MGDTKVVNKYQNDDWAEVAYRYKREYISVCKKMKKKKAHRFLVETISAFTDDQKKRPEVAALQHTLLWNLRR